MASDCMLSLYFMELLEWLYTCLVSFLNTKTVLCHLNEL